MNVREYLKEYDQIGEEIRRLNSQLNHILECREDTYNTLKAQKLSALPKSARLDGEDEVSTAALKVVELYSKSTDAIRSQINEILDSNKAFNETWSIVGLLDSDERKIIDLRYFQGKPWADVAQRTFFCWQQCKRIADNAISKLQKAIDDKYSEAI